MFSRRIQYGPSSLVLDAHRQWHLLARSLQKYTFVELLVSLSAQGFNDDEGIKPNKSASGELYLVVRQVLHIYGIAPPSSTSAICYRRMSASNSARDRVDIPEVILASCASLSFQSQESVVNDAI